jgi:DNA-binding transcriptional regulator YiaG
MLYCVTFFVVVSLLLMTEWRVLQPQEIATLRAELGWTQAVMAQFFQVTPRSIQNWESGNAAPNNYQMAALVQLRNRMDHAKAQRKQEQFQQGLQDLMPKILFGAGVFILLAYLFSDDD